MDMALHPVQSLLIFLALQDLHFRSIAARVVESETTASNIFICNERNLFWSQEILEKVPQLPEDISWHFIGHLQSNKAKSLIGTLPSLTVCPQL